MCGEERFQKRIYMTRSRNKFQKKLRKKGKKYFFGETVCLCCAFMMKAGRRESIAVSKRLFPQTFPLPPPPPPYIPQIAPSTSCFFEEIPFPPFLFRSYFVSLPFLPFPLLAFGFVSLRRESIISPKVHCLNIGKIYFEKVKLRGP